MWVGSVGLMKDMQAMLVEVKATSVVLVDPFDHPVERRHRHGWARHERLWLKALLVHVQAKMVTDGG